MPIIIESQPDNPKVIFREPEPPRWEEAQQADRIIGVRGYSLARQLASQESCQLEVTKEIPRQLLDRYRHAAMRKAVPRQLEDGTWYAEIPGFEGVWANEETLRDCLNVLDEVLMDWLLLKIQDEDRDIPVLENIDLNVL